MTTTAATKLVVVGMADMKHARDPGETLVTYALGSCIALVLYDPVAKVGGMLHAMLPMSSIDPAKAQVQPAVFVDTGVPLLFLESYKLGAKKERLQVKVAGGACTHGDPEKDLFQIGKRNVLMLKKLLWTNNVPLAASDVAGTESRTVLLDLETGRIRIRTPRGEHEL